MSREERIGSLASDLDVDADIIEDDLEKLASYDVSLEAAERTIHLKHAEGGTNIFDVADVGTVRGHFLLEAGYDTVTALASATVEELADVKYLSPSIAESVIASAVDQLRAEVTEPQESRGDDETAGSAAAEAVDVQTQLDQQTRAEAAAAPFTAGDALVEATSPVNRDDDYPGSCGFVFDPEGWSGRIRDNHRLDVEMFDDGIWRCPHEAPEGESYCVFHRSPDRKSDGEVATALLNKIDGAVDGRVETQFVAARFGDLDLESRRIDPSHNYRIVLAHSTFRGELDLSDAQVTTELDLSHSRLDGGLNLEDADFEDELRCHHCWVDSTLEGRDLRCRDRARFSHSMFNYGVRFDKSDFADLCTFTGATFDSYVTMNSVRFGGPASFFYADFTYKAEFTAAVFERDARFLSAEFDLDDDQDYVPAFENVRFEGEAIFGRHDRYDLDPPTFVQPPNFSGASFLAGTTFARTEFSRGASFPDADFADELDLTDTKLLGPVDFSNAKFATEIQLSPRTAGDATTHVDLTGASIAAGSFDQPHQGACYFDCSDAELGDVIVTNDEGDAFALDFVRMLRTEFDGFDFMRYRAGLERERWKIHTYERDASTDRHPVRPLDRELTYTRAKSGANQIGDGRAAAGFFKREMRARRDRFRERADDASRVAARLDARRKQLFNWAFDAVCRYGEGPIRTGLSTVILMGLFGLVYAIIFPLFAESTPYAAMDWPVAAKYGLFSVESFVAFVHNPAANIRSIVIRTVSVFEGFLGAFFIALFLFTLTRYVHR